MTGISGPQHKRVEISVAAVRVEDIAALEREWIELRNRYSRGGSSFGICALNEGTVIRR